MNKSAVPALRAGVISALALPFGLAAFAAAMTGHYPPLEVMAPILALVVSVVIACWLRAIPHLRVHRRPDDDGDDQWRRGRDDDPRRPDGGFDGPPVDWTAFEQDFAAYVRACDSRVAVSARSRPATHAMA